jgi:hypothetical protein
MYRGSPQLHQRSFGLSNRFPETKQYTKAMCYEPSTSDFGKSRRNSNEKAGFGAVSTRFDYYSSKRKHGALPSPSQYLGTDMPNRYSSTFGSKGPSPTHVFGTSRRDMKKLYVDAIFESAKRPENTSPGAGKYHLAYDWAPKEDFSKTKVTAKWSMG